MLWGNDGLQRHRPFSTASAQAKNGAKIQQASARWLTCCHLAEGSAAAAADEQGFRRHERALALVVQAEHAALQHAAAGGGEVLEHFDALHAVDYDAEHVTRHTSHVTRHTSHVTRHQGANLLAVQQHRGVYMKSRGEGHA